LLIKTHKKKNHSKVVNFRGQSISETDFVDLI
jgi:hypothetical protein